jgi:hypothetical protein
LSHPPEAPDPGASGDADGDPVDPWAAPSGGEPHEHLSYPPPPSGRPPDGQPGYEQSPYPAYGQPPGDRPRYEQSPYPPYGQPQYGGWPYGGYPQRVNGKAQAAMWTGIGLLVLSCCAAGVFGVVPIVLGVKARGEIRASGGQQSGDGMALTGIVTGAIALALSLVVIALVVGLAVRNGSGFDSYGTTRA